MHFGTHPIGDRAIPLWLTCFPEDRQEDISALLSLLPEDGVMLSAEENGTPVCQGLLLPLSLDGKQGYYVYAVGTHPDVRGRGYMRALLSRAKEFALTQGKEFLILIAATPRLGDTYRRAGFTTELPLAADEAGRHPIYRLAPDEALFPFDGDFHELYRRYGGELSCSLLRAAIFSVLDKADVFYTARGGFCVLEKESGACFTADPETLSRCKKSKSPYRALLCPLSSVSFSVENADPLPR